MSMPTRVPVEPSLLRWASHRSGRSFEALSRHFPVDLWERNERQPTLKQLERFAHATNTPIGFLMLSEPPDLPLPVPDFRTLPQAGARSPSPDLLKTIYLCEERQEWYRNHQLVNHAERLALVGSVSVSDAVAATAARMRSTLGFELSSRREFGSWSEALGRLSEHAEDVGILVMVSGVVGSNTHRVLDPAEFRGFALVDDLAPLVFINGADTNAAQIFTSAHELVHVWIGEPAVSNPRLDVQRETHDVERFCNSVAAELLVPMDDLAERFDAERAPRRGARAPGTGVPRQRAGGAAANL